MTLPSLPPPERAAYLLDFDGTLVDIAAAPDQVQVPPALPQHLRALRRRCGDAVAVVTGRPIAQVDRYLDEAAFAVSGEHGTAARLSPGAAPRWLDLPPTPADLLHSAERLVAATPGLILEHKHYGFVVHFRAALEAGDAVLRLFQAGLPPESGYKIAPAKMAWEIRPAGTDKGVAVRLLMGAPPFAGRFPIFVGDDRTDEDGMAVARALGGVGLRVDEAFGDPAGVRRWIAALAEGAA